MNTFKISGVTVNLDKMTNATTASEIASALESQPTATYFADLLAAQEKSIRTINVIEKSDIPFGAANQYYRDSCINWSIWRRSCF